MAVNTFNVDADQVRRQHFAQWQDFSVAGTTTATTVGEFILDSAAELSSLLRTEGIDAEGIVVETDAAFIWCASFVRMLAALKVYGTMPGGPPKSLTDAIDARTKSLEKNGVEALGGGTVPVLAGVGTNQPKTFIGYLNVDTGTPNPSPLIPKFRRDDEL